MDHLPIDVILGTNPPRFRWHKVVTAPDGTTSQSCEGPLPPSVDRAVEALIGVAKRALMDNAALRGQVEVARQRLEKQEKQEEQDRQDRQDKQRESQTPQSQQRPPTQHIQSSMKKGRG